MVVARTDVVRYGVEKWANEWSLLHQHSHGHDEIIERKDKRLCKMRFRFGFQLPTSCLMQPLIQPKQIVKTLKTNRFTLWISIYLSETN